MTHFSVTLSAVGHSCLVVEYVDKNEDTVNRHRKIKIEKIVYRKFSIK